jgi:hypothetical protein
MMGVDDTRSATMAEPARPAAPANEPGYTRSDAILFQSWLILFLLVICFALVNYLISYLPV